MQYGINEKLSNFYVVVCYQMRYDSIESFMPKNPIRGNAGPIKHFDVINYVSETLYGILLTSVTISSYLHKLAILR